MIYERHLNVKGVRAVCLRLLRGAFMDDVMEKSSRKTLVSTITLVRQLVVSWIIQPCRMTSYRSIIQSYVFHKSFPP